MAIPFSRSLRSLEADGFRRWTLGVCLVAAMLGLWGWWFLDADVPVYEVTPAARLEVSRAVHPIDALAGGRIATLHMRLGQQVEAGEVLVELDAAAEDRRLEQEQARQDALSGQLDALRAEIAAEEQSSSGTTQAARAGVEEARARLAETQLAERFAAEDLERKTRLRAAGQVPEAEFSRAKFEAQKLKAAAETVRLGLVRLESENKAQEGTGLAKVAELRRALALLDGQRAASAALVLQLRDEVEKRRLRSPVAGQVAEVAELQIGGVVREADRLGAVVPPGELKAIAFYAPEAALGRIRAGQRGRLRLDGFPWMQYGSVEATVSGLASEVRDGRIRVELAVQPDPRSKIPLQHGLGGTLEIEVERTSPAALVLRSAGKLLTGPAAGAP